jgi:hypothetical protein
LWNNKPGRIREPGSPPAGPVGQPGSRKDEDMNRHMAGAAMMVLLLAGVESVEARTAARVEYRDGRIGVAVVIGDLPVRVVHPQHRGVGWVAADLGPARMWKGPGRISWRQEVLRSKELRRLLGRDTVKMLERHARTLRLRGPIQGQWYRADRRTVVLEVTVRGAPVAKFYDHGSNGVFERMYLARSPRPHR